MPLASITIRALIGPAFVITPGPPSGASMPMTGQGCRTSAPTWRARESSRASRSARQTWNPLHGPLASLPKGSKRRGLPHSIQMPVWRAPTTSANRSATPSCANRGSTPGCSVSPGRSRPGRSRSHRTTHKPRRAQAIAAELPAGPPPTTTTSASSCLSHMTRHRAAAAPCSRQRRRRPAVSDQMRADAGVVVG